MTPASPADASPRATSPADAPDRDALDDLLRESVRQLEAGRPQEALVGLDRVIAGYQQRHAGEKRRIYCAGSPAEMLVYLTSSAAKGEDALALSPTWADAWFYRAYALVELGNLSEARTALDRALGLSPSHTAYLAESGHLYQLAKDWTRALAIFEEAADAAALVTDPAQRASHKARAQRGQGYALIELGDLDAAERLYLRILAVDPDDAKAKQELDYIQQVRSRPR